MAFLDVKLHQGQNKFDWDDISVGNTQLDHSQNFFARKHYEHERLDDMEFLEQKMIKTEICDSVETYDDKANVAGNRLSPNNKENDNKTINTPCPNILKLNEEYGASPVKVEKDIKVKQKPCRKLVENLAWEWSVQKPISSQAVACKGSGLRNMPPPPQAYLIKDIYQRNREEAKRLRTEEERKLREFHSRPAPKFNLYHEQLQKRKPTHAYTMPVTPQVLKKSREAEEKRRKKLEEWKEKNQPPKFEPRQPTVLKEKPFVPERKPTVVQQCPFNLHVEKRLQERKHYHEVKQKALEEKQKQEEEERKRYEKECIKELRKATTFKARPNPFKH